MLNNEQTLKDSLCKNVRIRYWSNGFEVPLECKIESVVESSYLIIVSKNNQFIYINFEHIYEIIKGDYLFM